jgi:uncharacterized Zn-binding protein involved in type VI secretion
MVRRYLITLGASTTAGGRVISAHHYRKINGVPVAREDDFVECPQCRSVGVIKRHGPRLGDDFKGKQVALHDDLCICKCDPPPRLIANQTLVCQTIDPEHFAAQAAATATAAQVVATAQASSAKEAGDLLPIRLLQSKTREPFKHRPYKLHLTGKVIIEGTTDGEGCTQPLSAADRASVIAWHVEETTAT